MTADFTHILMPKKGGLPPPPSPPENSTTTHPQVITLRNNSSPSSSPPKYVFLTVFIFLVGLTVVSMGLLIKCVDRLDRYQDKLDRYEDKLSQNERRVTLLEGDLERFIKHLLQDPDEEELEYETRRDYEDDEDEEDVLDEEEEDDDHHPPAFQPQPPKGFHSEEDSPEDIRVRVVGGGGQDEGGQYGKVELEKDDESTPPPKEGAKSRKKRQIAFPNTPTFGPEVERTESGVPIVEESYLTSSGVTARYPSSNSRRGGDSQAFRLYQSLGTSSRPSHRNFDSPNRQPESSSSSSTLLPHHQISAAWSEPSSPEPRSRLQLKSGDNYAAASTSGEVTPSRSSQSSRRSQHYTYPARGGASSTSTSTPNSHTFYSPPSGNSGATYHRNSRVPSTGDYFYPTTTTTTTPTKTYSHHRTVNDEASSSTRVQYPPLRKLNVGNGEGEVIARVLQTDRDDTTDNNFASANLGESEASSSRRVYRGRQNQTPLLTPGQVTSSAHTASYTGRANRKYGSAGGGYRNRDQMYDSSGEVTVTKAEAYVEGPKPLAAHYVADVSNYTTAHKHYDGNGRLRNADGIFEAWRPADWMTVTTANSEGAAAAASGSKSFVLSPNGVLTVKKAGLYYIYAQIHYLDEHDINGFIVQVNTDPLLQCTTMTETYNSGSKSNSCFTAGIHYLKADDRITIKDIETNRYSIFKPEKSFFGLMKVGAVP